MPELYGYEVSQTSAEETVEAIFDSPIKFLDTSNNYGAGRSERAIGNVIKRRGLPKDFIVASKVDADQVTSEFTAVRVRKSLEESLERLNLDYLPILYFHDPEYHISFEDAVAKNGPVAELLRIKSEGLVGNIGIASFPIDLMTQYVETGWMDIVLSHNRYTLLDRSALSLMQLCKDMSISFINAAAYGGGFLATEKYVEKYAYRTASSELLDAKDRLIEVCKNNSVALSVLSLQWSLRSELVTSTVVGTAKASRVSSLLSDSQIVLSEEIWDQVEEALSPLHLFDQ